MNITNAHNRFKYLSPEELVNGTKENLLLFAYINASRPQVIDTDWDKFVFNAVNPIGGESLEIIFSNIVVMNDQVVINDAVNKLLSKFNNTSFDRKTDRIRLFYPVFSFLFHALQRYTHSDVGIVKQLQHALLDLNSDVTKPLTEILNPDWVDSYTFEEDEVEFFSVIGRNTDIQVDTNSLVMEFDSTEFEIEEEDLESAGDGLHKAAIFNYAEIQEDMTVTKAELSGIRNKAREFVWFSNIYSDTFFDQFLSILHSYEAPQNRFAFYVMVENLLPDDFIPAFVINKILIHNMSLEDFELLFGEIVLESIFADKSPTWDETNIAEIDKFHNETINQLVKINQSEKDPTTSRSYLVGYFKSLLNGGNSKDAIGAGWDAYRTNLSPEGQTAYKQAIREGKSYKDAMRAFWSAYNNTIISFSQNGLTLKSQKIDWRRAYYKAQAREIPQSQLGKLVEVAVNLLTNQPNNYWLEKLAFLSI